MIDFKKIFKVTPKKGINPVLKMLWVQNGFVYATDSFKAVRLITKFDPTKTGLINNLAANIWHEEKKVYKDIEIFPSFTEYQGSDKHPGEKMDSIIPTTFTKEITVNRKYLIDLLEAMQKSTGKGRFDDITLKTGTNREGRTEMLVLENGNGIGLLMPVSR